MTFAWPTKPTPEPTPEALPPTVVGPGGARYLDCATVAGVDRHIEMLRKQLVAHAKFPRRVSEHWQDVDALLERRHLLQLETWLTVADLPL
jgi:hypothetical protein